MGTVHELNVVTRLDLPVEKIIRKAEEAELTEIIVLGLTPDGNFYFAGSKADGAQALWLLKIAEKRLLEIMDVNPDKHPTDPPSRG